MDIYYWIEFKVVTICKFFYYGWKLRNTVEFDAGSIYGILYIKLNRIHQCMKKDHHLVWNSTESSNLMRKLCEAKYLAKKLDNDVYIRHYSSMANKYATNTDSFLRKLNLYPNSKIIDQKLFKVMLRKSTQRDRKEYTNDKDRLFYLLNKYIESWWD